MSEPTDPAVPWSQQIINNASNLGNQGIFVTQVPPPPMPLDQAQALLADLPLDDIPEISTEPSLSSATSPNAQSESRRRKLKR